MSEKPSGSCQADTSVATAREERSTSDAPHSAPQARALVSYEMFIAMKDAPSALYHYMHAGGDLEEATRIAKIVAANAAVDQVLLVEYEHTATRKGVAWASAVETSYALAAAEGKQS